ncbi:hypothetical protein [Zavarzinia sp.]|uniref:hypothetical protein n=1 Tax=Zavarzinia sp. TaxID=2027920 RepID=UPI003BB638E5
MLSDVYVRAYRPLLVVAVASLALVSCGRPRLSYEVGPPSSIAGQPLLDNPSDSCPAAQSNWVARADTNKDGAVDLGEAKADARRFFAMVDADNNGVVTPSELTDYRIKTYPAEYRRSIATPLPPTGAPVKTPGGTELPDPEKRRYLLTPATTDLVMAADADLDFRVTLDEVVAKMTERGAKLDDNGDGRISAGEAAAFCG